MCCSGFLRTVMIVFNAIIFLAGNIILGLGIWVKVESESLVKVLWNTEDTPEGANPVFHMGYLLIAVGAVLLVMGFLGCCGAMKESPCMLLLFFVIVLLIFIAEVAGVVMIFIFNTRVEELINKLALESIREDYGTKFDLTGLWNSIMEVLNCCGFYNYTDFTGSPFNNMTAGRYPDTCCLNSPCTLENSRNAVLILHCCSELSHFNPSPSQKVPGCYPKLVDLLESNAVIVGAVATGIAALEISGLVTVIFGLWMKYGTTSFVAALDSYSMQLFTESYIYMGTGSTVILIGAIGFCGALKENRWLILLVRVHS
ncbi:tetraspanin-1-like [Scleropages formosus]|uniref:tetraspanin-1-like n=1 Tax=Scleropages formosus TaxID=113540 RepID=UPI0010FA8CE4|nr:tetraspanin-1-like [Scleropages formosus]